MTGTLARPPARPAGRPTPGHTKRLDVQGLRAVAVLVVIADHLWQWPAGGFVGVDVFFVISGFMITGLMLREREKTGTISFGAFYRRRAKRLLPASLTVLAVTVGVAHVLFSQSRFRETVTDALWALLFAGNWRNASKQTDYFAADGPVSPIQHYWSLGVEEQFYFVWPAVMLLALFLANQVGLARRHQRLGVAAVLGAIVAGSLVWAFHETATIPDRAYFSTFSRAWELGVGAMVAATAAFYRRIPDALRPVLSALGMAGIAASLFLIDGASPFPAPWALLPVLSAALVLIAGEGGPQRGMPLLTNRVSVYTGDISYSLYLWHFPVIIFAGELVDLDDPLASAATLALLLVISVQAYHLLEDPVRKSSWLEPRVRRRNRSKVLTRRYGATALTALVVVAGCTLFVRDKLDVSDAPPVFQAGDTSPITDAPDPVAGSAITALQSQVQQALGATTWPDLTPSMEKVIKAEFVTPDIKRCGLMGPVPDGCVFGDPNATKTAVIVGDSVAESYVASVRSVLARHQGWKLMTFASTGCTFTAVKTVQTGGDTLTRCPAKKEEAVNAILQAKPALVFVSNTYEPRREILGEGFNVNNSRKITPSMWRTSTQRIVDRFAGSAGKVVFLAPPPGNTLPAKCYSRTSQPADCVGPVSQTWVDTATQEAAMAKAVGGEWVDTRPLFCSPQGNCPIFAGGVVIRPDKVHVSPTYGQKMVPALDEMLTGLGVLS